MRNPRFLRLLEATAVLLFLVQAVRVVFSVLFGLIYDTIFAGRVSFVTLPGVQGYATGFQDLHHVEVIKLVADGKGEDGEIRERPLGLQRYGGLLRGLALFFPEGSFADHVVIAVE